VFKGFKEFILRGNVIDLAVAVVIGAAFTGIVTGLVEGILNPSIALLFNADDLSTAGITLRPESSDGAGDAIVLAWGRVISALIQFLLVATVVYFALIVPMNYFRKHPFGRKKQNEPEPAPVPTEQELLTEIRDLLKVNPRVEERPAQPDASRTPTSE
jgi:large conductance mechanosensitive channel